MKKMIICFVLLLSISVRAEDHSLVLHNLSSIKEKIESIKYFTERADLGRLIMLQKTIDKVSNSILKNGLAHNKTMNSFLEMSISFKYSQSFFKTISAGQTYATINEIQSMSKQISADRGYDESPSTQVTANILSQVANLMEEIRKRTTDKNLSSELNRIMPELGKAIAIAQQGDRPLAFQSADVVIKKIILLSPSIEKLISSVELTGAVVELQGLVEFYKDFSQFGERYGDR